MPKYKGKRSNVTFPLATFETLSALAERETKTVSQMVVSLCEEALKARGIAIASKTEQ
ncbi:ribbon-helix-helix domain-containing protein [Scytonema sp. NUACC26]|uniref:ribbon-helix-helix domain-containing protein n=1 Tax=Scytonema sp. NUACC26 TaxID=3140176 RepID=UPI0034DBA7F1